MQVTEDSILNSFYRITGIRPLELPPRAVLQARTMLKSRVCPEEAVKMVIKGALEETFGGEGWLNPDLCLTDEDNEMAEQIVESFIVRGLGQPPALAVLFAVEDIKETADPKSWSVDDVELAVQRTIIHALETVFEA